MCFNNIILSQLPLILGPKSSLFPCGMWLVFVFVFVFVLVFVFCFVSLMTSVETGGKKTNIFCSMNIIPVLCIWDIYIVSLEMGVQ